MKNIHFFIVFLTLLSCGQKSRRIAPHPLQSVPQFKINTYMGLWHEIAKIPNRFQDDCLNATAEYSLLENGNVKVLNTCFEKSNKISTVEGIAKKNSSPNLSQFEVKFYKRNDESNFFLRTFSRGNYWVIRLGDNYEYAVVSEPLGAYLWILSRTPKMDDTTYQTILRSLKEEDGFETSAIVKN